MVVSPRQTLYDPPGRKCLEGRAPQDLANIQTRNPAHQKLTQKLLQWAFSFRAGSGSEPAAGTGPASLCRGLRSVGFYPSFCSDLGALYFLNSRGSDRFPLWGVVVSEEGGCPTLDLKSNSSGPYQKPDADKLPQAF